ncbi:MAG: arylesterase [Deltaproteobacteria bacterium]|nr:arylesterase [Deltaproteobacteria bacterium]
MKKPILNLSFIIAVLCSVALALGKASASEPATILFLGDSLTAGYGIEQELAYPALVALKAREAGYNIEIINAGMSGDTSAGGVRRLPWILQRKVDIAVIALGANDGLRGLPVSTLKENLAAIVSQIRSKYPNCIIVVAGMKLPRNLGNDYNKSFEAVFEEVAREHNTEHIPFLLKEVAADPSLNQPDRLHPTSDGHEKIAATVWLTLEPILSKMQRG